jgi:hypothetical protein
MVPSPVGALLSEQVLAMWIPSMKLVQLVASVIAATAAGSISTGLAQTEVVRGHDINTTWSGNTLAISNWTSAHPLRRKQGKVLAVSLTGRWHWRANCPGGRYRGGAYISQLPSNRFSGRLGNTSFYDRGTISGGRLRGRNASFTLNAFGSRVRIRAVISVSQRRRVEARAAYTSPQFGRCHLRFTKL